MDTKFCENCGSKIAADSVICPKCGVQLEKLKTENKNSNPQIVINNTNNGGCGMRKCNKWVSLLLCLFLGVLGGHKFYEGKGGMGVLYIFTCGLCFIGVFVDIILILCKPNPYYV